MAWNVLQELEYVVVFMIYLVTHVLLMYYYRGRPRKTFGCVWPATFSIKSLGHGYVWRLRTNLTPIALIKAQLIAGIQLLKSGKVEKWIFFFLWYWKIYVNGRSSRNYMKFWIYLYSLHNQTIDNHAIILQLICLKLEVN